MLKGKGAEDPDAYVSALSGWRRSCVDGLRYAVAGAAEFEEVVRWGHLVYLLDGPAILIRAEDDRVLFGFWRGKRLLEIEPRLRPGGKYEMASLELGAEDEVPETARRLAREAAALNRELGDPRKAARRAPE